MESNQEINSKESTIKNKESANKHFSSASKYELWHILISLSDPEIEGKVR